ncbi:MAG: hypothetical protein M1400_00890 [Patescibacteria group bacterium]|nr:hypothetical protein [Patescibacteria group bacterium]
MNYFLLLIAIIAGYFFIVFVLLRLVAPFMGFGGFKAPAAVPDEMQKAIKDLESKAASQQAYLQAVYDLVLEKTLHQWQHTRFKAGTRIYRMTVRDLKEIWSTQKFIYCGPINFAVFTLLVKSRYFTEQDIRVRHVFLNFVPHQYLQVRIGEKWVDVDPAGAGIRNQPLGTHASFFG